MHFSTTAVTAFLLSVGTVSAFTPAPVSSCKFSVQRLSARIVFVMILQDLFFTHILLLLLLF